MALAFVFDFPEATSQQYQRVQADLARQLGANQAPGRLLHAAGPHVDGWRVVEIWESRDALDDFFRAHLAGALDRARMPGPLPPEVVELVRLER